MTKGCKIILISLLALILIFSGSLSLLQIKPASASQTYTGDITSTSTSPYTLYVGNNHNMETTITTNEQGSFTFTIASDGTITGSGTGTSKVVESGDCNGQVTFSSTMDISGGVSFDAKGNLQTVSIWPHVHVSQPLKIDQQCKDYPYLSGPTYVAIYLGNRMGSAFHPQFDLPAQNGASVTEPASVVPGTGQTTVTIHGSFQGATPQPTPPPQPIPTPQPTQCDPDQVRDQNGKCVNLPITLAGPVTQVNGDVKVQQSDGSWKQVREGDVISEGQTIKTGPNSWISVDSVKISTTFYDESKVALGENSEFQIGQHPKLIQGHLWVLENHRKGECELSCLIISSFLEKIVVNGTDFITGYFPYLNVQYVALKEGSVDVTLLATNQTFHYDAPRVVFFHSPNVTSGTLDQGLWNNLTGSFPVQLDAPTTPEFGPITPIIFAISILSIIILSVGTRFYHRS